MKITLILCAILCFSIVSHAQTASTSFQPVPKDTLRVNLDKENMSATYKNQPIPVHSIAALDSFMKKIPDLQHLQIVFESVNTKPETSRSINQVLRKCNCPITSKSQSFANH